MHPRILLIDIETSPEDVETWGGRGGHEVNVLRWKKYTQIISFAWKWYGQKVTHCRKLPDYENYKIGEESDELLMRDIWKVLDEADIVVGQNSDAFDIKVINARLWKYGLGPPSPFKQVDVLKESYKIMKLPSHKLDQKARYRGYGKKIATGGYELWVECLDPTVPVNIKQRAWRKMEKYNKHDVSPLLEEDYKSLLPWMKNHPNINFYQPTLTACRNCGSLKIEWRGKERVQSGWKPRYQCQSCGKWGYGKIQKDTTIIVR